MPRFRRKSSYAEGVQIPIACEISVNGETIFIDPNDWLVVEGNNINVISNDDFVELFQSDDDEFTPLPLLCWSEGTRGWCDRCKGIRVNMRTTNTCFFCKTVLRELSEEELNEIQD